MSEIAPTFSGEVQLAGWSESHNGGCKVTFWLSDPSDLDAFRTLTVRKGNTAGHRMMAALVEINDDEQPVPPEPKERLGPYCYQAVKWCADKEFQQFMLTHYLRPKDFPPSDAKWAEIAVKQICGVGSRKEIDGNERTEQIWQECIAGPYRKWRIARGLE